MMTPIQSLVYYILDDVNPESTSAQMMVDTFGEPIPLDHNDFQLWLWADVCKMKGPNNRDCTIPQELISVEIGEPYDEWYYTDNHLEGTLTTRNQTEETRVGSKFFVLDSEVSEDAMLEMCSTVVKLLKKANQNFK
jgi:hypothetical protein